LTSQCACFRGRCIRTYVPRVLNKLSGKCILCRERADKPCCDTQTAKVCAALFSSRGRATPRLVPVCCCLLRQCAGAMHVLTIHEKLDSALQARVVSLLFLCATMAGHGFRMTSRTSHICVCWNGLKRAGQHASCACLDHACCLHEASLCFLSGQLGRPAGRRCVCPPRHVVTPTRCPHTPSASVCTIRSRSPDCRSLLVVFWSV